MNPFRALCEEPARVRRSEDAKMALGKLHLYALAKRLHPDADFDVREGSGGLPGDREKAARAELDTFVSRHKEREESGISDL